MKNIMRPLLLAALCLCGWCPGAPAATLGNNLAGEACWSSVAPAPDAPAPIACGSSAETVGQVWTVPLDQPWPRDANGRRNTILRLVASQSEDEKIDCEAPRWIGSHDVLLRTCTLKSSGWPRIVLGVEAGGRVYRAEGAPSSTPVLEAAIASEAQGNLSKADAGALQQALQRKYPASVLRAPEADYATFGKLIEDARLAAASDNYAAAESDYRAALAIEERLFGRDALVVGQTLAELGLEASNQGRFADAAALFGRARPIIEASANDDARARLDSYEALDAANARNYAAALAFARKATAARRDELGLATLSDVPSDATTPQIALANRGELAHSLRIEAEMALRLGDLALARASAEEALWIVSEEPGLPLWWRADTAALMGEINEAQDRVVQAEHDFQDARNLDLKLFGDTAPTASADFALGEFYTRQQLYPAALDAFRAGFAIARKDRTARAEVQADSIVAFIAAETAAANAKSMPERDGEIFRAIQLSKTGVADQAVARIAAREASGDSGLADLIGRTQQAERDRDRAQVELAAEYAKLDEERNAARENQLAADEKLASANADGLLAKVKASFPQYADLSQPEPAELSAVQAQLAPHEALIVYVLGTNSGYALVATRSSFQAVPLAVGRDALAADISDVRRSLSRMLGRVRDFSLQSAHALYQQLIDPVRSQLADIDRLIVVPGSTLSSLPFALLVGEAPDRGRERDYAHADWLVRQFAVSEMPSPRAFLSLRDDRLHRTAPPRPFLGIGAPAFLGASGAEGNKVLADLTASCREDGPVSAALLRALPPLPETAAEVRTIGARLGDGDATLLLGEEATESNFRSEPLDQYAVIYFATHGLLPGELHCAGEPALVLTPPDGAVADSRGDGILNASEIARLKLNADLVVLSACNTAEDVNEPGGGALEGLSDAFFVAGAHAVLASHWEVSSASTTALMLGLFDRAHGGEGLAESLRQSQLSLIEQPSTAHPFYWAAFTLMGDGGPLKRGAGNGNAQTAQAGQP